MSECLLLERAFRAGVDAVSAPQAMARAVLRDDPPPVAVIAFGKAAAAMAVEALATLAVQPKHCLVVCPRGHAGAALPAVAELIEAGHPHPDENSLRAGARAIAIASGLRPSDRLLALASGGGSALLAAPAPGLDFDDKRRTIAALHRAGASIGEINAVRAGLSAVKGGRLGAAANGAFVDTLVISDIPGDDPAIVASGPTIATGRGRTDACAILSAYGIPVSPGAERALMRSGPASFPQRARIIARADDALAAAAGVLTAAGYGIVNLGGALEGDAAALARAHAERARELLAAEQRVAIVSGGETTVTLPAYGAGRGGRNTTYLLALAIALAGAPGVSAFAADTDGIDGSEENAGAFIAPDTLARARANGLDAADSLAKADAFSFFAAIGDLFVTGPTLTNVNDLRIILVDPCR